jgi:hypothetical protein
MPEPTAEQRIAGAARQFELPALLRVLRRRGYGPEAVQFEGIRGDVAAPGLVDSLHFEARRVVVRLNVGLLAPGGPLPSYFRRFLEDAEDPRPLLAFLRFFEHVLARSRSHVAFPRDGAARGSPLGRAYQLMAGAATPARLHALFRALVPELAVEVEVAALDRSLATAGARLGSAGLDGTAILGPRYRTRGEGLLVRLHTEHERDDAGRPWADVVRERSRRADGLLARSRRPIEVRLRVATYRGAARLAARQLGAEPLGGAAAPWELTVLSAGQGRGAA